ncbi:MAG: rhodanese-like domain-containing protein [Terriglobia bacterium]|jgi:adenylyltransferase/sulfurtransferase|nr:rhodanese-like domain-containing protein [Terriglobia bacterium]
MHAEDLKQRLDAQDDVFVLDVREPHEYQAGNIGGHLIPLNDLPGRLGELDPDRETVVYCRSGVRSTRAVEFLRAQGFSNVKNLTGGILAWAEKVDPRLKGRV